MVSSSISLVTNLDRRSSSPLSQTTRCMDSSDADPSTFYEWSSGIESVENDEKQTYNCDDILGNEHHNENQLVEKCFPSREDLVKHVKKLAIAQGFVVNIKRSCTKANWVILGCNRGGTYRNLRNVKDDEWKKNTSFCLMNCPFEVKGRQNVDGSWKLTIKNLEHNHERPNVLVGHPNARRFSEEEEKKIKEMNSNNIPSCQILTKLRKENPNLEATSRDLYNMMRRLRKKESICQLDILFDNIKKKYRVMSPLQQCFVRNELHKLASNMMPLNHEHSKGRHRGSKVSNFKNSTRRNPFAFDIVKNVRRCKICKNVGYNCKTCPNQITAHASESVDSNVLPNVDDYQESETASSSQLSQTDLSYNFYEESTCNSSQMN